MKIEDYKREPNKYYIEEKEDSYLVYEYVQADTTGCILIGKDLAYIDRDKSIDVTSSRDSIKELLELLGTQTVINIEIL